mgnify:CR=1 FL=1
MIRVEVNGDLEKGIKRFKQKQAFAAIPSEVKKRSFYTKPGEKRREAVKAGIKAAKKKAKRSGN